LGKSCPPSKDGVDRAAYAVLLGRAPNLERPHAEAEGHGTSVLGTKRRDFS
jgi:hypothetical protein